MSPLKSAHARSPSKDMAAFMALCNELAKAKEYDKALGVINKALRTGNSVSRVTLLDLRIALYLRMDKLTQALVDAKAMIRLDRKDGRGYLRCGQIESLRNNRAEAIKFMEHGLKNVPPVDPNFQSILKELDKAQKELKARLVLSKPKDPVKELPLEVVQLIFSFLDYKQHVQMLRVSRAWRRVIQSTRPMIDTLTFAGARKLVTPKMLHVALRRLQSPKYIRVVNLTDQASDILMKTLERYQSFRELQYLEVQNSWFLPWVLPMAKYNLKTMIIGCSRNVPIEWVCTVLRECANLETAKFHDVSPAQADLRLENTSLRQLDLWIHSCQMNLNTFFVGVPRLTALSCRGVMSTEDADGSHQLELRHMKQLETLSFTHAILPQVFLPRSLRHLDLVSCLFIPLDERSTMSVPNFTVLDNLEYLSIIENVSFPRFILPVGTTPPKPGKLETCLLTHSHETEGDVAKLVQSGWLKGLKHLVVRGSTLNDSHSRFFIEGCPDIQTLALEGAMITGAFISDLLKAPSCKLRLIRLMLCTQVSSDVVPWAEVRGVKIKLMHHGLGPDLGGRRVREGE